MKEEQKQPIQPPKGGNGFFSKKWTFPVMYMGAAALILALIVWYQQDSKGILGNKDLMPQVSKGTQEPVAQSTAGTTPTQPGAVAVTGQVQALAWPVVNGTNPNVIMHYYDETAADDVKAAALVQYEDSYWPHTGIDLALKDGQSFDVVAAGPGKVTKAEKDPMVGYVVEIDHGNGLTTIYQSLEDTKLQVGSEVKQGDILGKAGRNLFEKSEGIHLHFEVKENGKSVSPEKLLSKKSEAQ
jgi:stage II sporulation protein Q